MSVERTVEQLALASPPSPSYPARLVAVTDRLADIAVRDKNRDTLCDLAGGLLDLWDSHEGRFLALRLADMLEESDEMLALWENSSEPTIDGYVEACNPHLLRHMGQLELLGVAS